MWRRKFSTRDFGGSGAQTHDELQQAKQHTASHLIVHMSHHVLKGEIGSMRSYASPALLAVMPVGKLTLRIHTTMATNEEQEGRE